MKGYFRFKVCKLDARERLESHGRKIDCSSQMNAGLFRLDVLEFSLINGILLGKVA